MKCPICKQHCSSEMAKLLAKGYLAAKVPRIVRIWRRLRKTVEGWPLVGWSR